MLETVRLRLRRLVPSDVDELTRTFSDPAVMRLVGAGLPLRRDEIEVMIERISQRFDQDGFGQLGVERRADGRLIGRAGLLAVDPVTWQGGSRSEIGERAKIEIGWTFERQAWGQGYAFEAARAIRDWAGTTLGLSQLVSIIQLGNTRSIRLAERLGERRDRRITTSFGKPAWLYALALASDEPEPGAPADGIVP
jgi:RimJ/RimL family protein N-acetyltransferase